MKELYGNNPAVDLSAVAHSSLKLDLSVLQVGAHNESSDVCLILSAVLLQY
jgi:hypothetical protein